MSKPKSEHLYTQVSLCSVPGPRGKESRMRLMTTWLNADPRVKEGAVISLKDYAEGTRWEITDVYATETLAKIDTHGWDNNDYSKHTGLWEENTHKT